MSVRRAYNIVRQMVGAKERLTFEEFAIVCHLAALGEPQKTSSIAEYQGALRPTMTHRTNHLEELGLITRSEGDRDRRNVVCACSDLGRDRILELGGLTCAQIPTGRALSRTSAERILKYVDAMGSYFCKAGDLVLLGLFVSEEEPLTIMQLVDALGLLQPTVSMSVSSLAARGLVERDHAPSGSHTTSIRLTPEGRAVAAGIAGSIEEIVVRRKARKTGDAQ